MPFELREHTADIAVEATGESLEETFSAVADGLAAASCEVDDVPTAVGERFDLSVAAESLEALLFEYLDELIYLRDVRLELPVENRVALSRRGAKTGGNTDVDVNADADADREWELEGSARGVPLSEIDAREVKAVTYSEMRLEAVDAATDSEATAWEAYVVFDV